jgi:hypothetical protein
MPLPALGMGLVSLAIEAAPTVARWFGGDEAEESTKKVTDIARAITGKETPEDAEQAIRNNPELFMQFKTAVMAHDLAMEKVYMENTKDARGRDIALKERGYRNTRADLMVLAAFVTLIAIVGALWAYQSEIPQAVLAIFTLMAGQLLKMLSDAFNFEFGSSRGSKEKSIKLGEHK